MKIQFNLLNNPVFSNFLKNSFWILFGTLFTKILNLLAITFIAKKIGPTSFGEYNVIQTTIGMFGTFAGLGLGLAATKLIAENRHTNPELVKNISSTLYTFSIIISTLIALAFLLFSKTICLKFLNNPSLIPLLQITSFIVIADSINGIQNGILNGYESFREITIASIISGIISSLLLIIGTIFNGITGITIMLLISRIINVAIFFFFLRKQVNILKQKVKLRLKNLKQILNISIPSFLSGMSTSPINWFSTTIFVSQPLGYTNLGIYNAANQLRTIVLFLPDGAGKVSIAQMANAFATKNRSLFKSSVFITLTWNFLLSLAPAFGLFFFKDYYQLIFGKSYNFDTYLILTILITGVLVAITNAIGYIFICSNLIWYDFILRVFWGITLLFSLLFYGRFHGALGYSFSVMIASIFHFITQLIILFLTLRQKLYNGKKKNKYYYSIFTSCFYEATS